MRLLSAAGVVGAVLGIVAWTALAASPAHVSAMPGDGSQAGGSGGLIALSCQAGEHRQQLAVIDPSMKVVGVYHIDTATGDIVLKSVRNIHWDLQMMEFNGASPSPREIRTLLEQR